MRIGSIASYGMAQALQRFEASAIRTARSSSAVDPVTGVSAAPPVDPVHEVVEVISAKHDFTANLAVLRTADEMNKRLLDIKV